jgi:hypothetical protein
MSSMELKAGKAWALTMPREFTTFKQEIGYLQNIGFVFDEVEFEDNYASCHNLVKANGTWYQLNPLPIDPSGCTITSKNLDGSLDYILYWYNGGGGFDEVFASALNK